VEAVGATGDQPDLVVERFGAALVDLEADGGEDPSRCLRIVWPRRTNGCSRLRAALERNRSISIATSSTVRPGAKIARSASLRVYARQTSPPARLRRRSVRAWFSLRFSGALSSDQRASLNRRAAVLSPSERSSFQ
jgi:hypothetical protein